MHIIAADVGGTKTRLVFAHAEQPENILFEARYLSNAFDSFEPLLKTFIDASGATGEQVDALTLALPGPVSENSVRLTNLPWTIEKQALIDAFGIKDVHFMNDFQASAFGACLLSEKDRLVLNPGDGLEKNNTCVAVGAGTGLGLAWIQGENDRLQAYATEGGHIDYAPVDETQVQLLQYMLKRHQHVSYERLLSGSGLVTLYEFLAGKECPGIDAAWVNDQSATNAVADNALTLFVQIYGAYIGNIALLFQPSGGIYITGGIGAKILIKMQSEAFINAYLNKGRMHAVVEKIAVYLVTNERIGVLGALSEAVKIQKGTK